MSMHMPALFAFQVNLLYIVAMIDRTYPAFCTLPKAQTSMPSPHTRTQRYHRIASAVGQETYRRPLLLSL